MRGWAFAVVVMFTGVVVFVALSLAGLAWRRRRQRGRDELVWQSLFNRLNPRVASGVPRTTEPYDYAKAVAGRRRAQLQTPTGRQLKSLMRIRREAQAVANKKATVASIKEGRRVAGGRQ